MLGTQCNSIAAGSNSINGRKGPIAPAWFSEHHTTGHNSRQTEVSPMSDPDPFLPIFKKLAADIDETTDFPARRLLLAHYTSIAALEGIVARQEVWFSPFRAT